MPGFMAVEPRLDVSSLGLSDAVGEEVLEIIVDTLLEVIVPKAVIAEEFEDIVGVGLAPVTADGELGGGNALGEEAALSQFDPFAIPNSVEYWYCPVTSSMSCKL
jgi:hypothetical protein